MNNGILITDKKDIYYHSGFLGSNGFLIKIKNKIYLFTDPRYKNTAQNLKSDTIKPVIIDSPDVLKNFVKNQNLKTLTFQESISYEKYLSFKRAFKKTSFIRSKGSVSECRTIKHLWELDLLKKAQEYNESILEKIRKSFKVGVTEKQIAKLIHTYALDAGLENLSFDPIVAFGKNAANIHHSPTDTKLTNSDVILIDMGVEYKHYQSDMSRTFLPASASKELKDDYQLVLDSHLYGINNAFTDKQIADLDAECRDILKDNPMQHSLGHGIGLDVHELPFLRSKGRQKLEKNMVITIEPGIYKENKYGIRIEDVVIVQDKKGQSISSAPKNISDMIWN